jgi:hypothetical protein
VVGTTAVGTSHVGVIVSVPGAGGPLNARAFRLWENGRPKNVRVDPLPGSALRVSVVVDARPGDQLQSAQNAVADLMIGLPDGAEAAVVGARPARLIQPLTGDAGSVVRALAAAPFSGPSDDASALALALRQVRAGPAGRRAVILITTSPVPVALVNALPGQLRAADASLYVAAVPDVAPSLAKLASDSGGWAVTASSARSLMPAVDAPPGGGSRSGNGGDRRCDRARAGFVRPVRCHGARLRRGTRWGLRGLADRRGVAGRPGRCGQCRPAAPAAHAQPLVTPEIPGGSAGSSAQVTRTA